MTSLRGALIRMVLVVVGMVLISSGAFAQDNRFDLGQFNPAMDNLGLFQLNTSQMYRPYHFGTGIWVDYMNKPLELNGMASNGTVITDDAVSHRMAMNTYFAIALCPYYEFGLTLPAVLFQDGTGLSRTTVPAKAALGDLRLNNKFRALNREEYPVGLAFVVSLVTPTGDEEEYAGERVFATDLLAVVDAELGPVVLATNLGFTFRPSTMVMQGWSDAYDLKLGHEWLYRFGVQYNTPLKGLSAMMEWGGKTLLESPFDQRFNNPMVWDIGARYDGPYDLQFNLGLGVGMVPGYGTGPVRVMAGVSWSYNRADSDQDGVPDEDDQCPDNQEDQDGFEDSDGCVDEDNDKDGVLDVQDRCPNIPEDLDDFQDDDGCPEEDNDQDHIFDEDDRCPNAAEDFDNDEDEDGCPDYDRDQDGIPDSSDRCPDEPEDKDGVKDEDGCPDLDDDKDGVLQDQDLCPKQKEDKDGFEDEDGCPDPDNDSDGILDKQDRCPMKPETINGNQDQDGCPDEGDPLVIFHPNRLELKQAVAFKRNSPMLDLASFALLNQVAATLKAHKEAVSVRVEGLPQGRGTRAESLAEARAKAVTFYLTNQGIEAKRLETKALSSQEAKGRKSEGDIGFAVLKVKKPSKPKAPAKKKADQENAKPEKDKKPAEPKPASPKPAKGKDTSKPKPVIPFTPILPQ